MIKCEESAPKRIEHTPLPLKATSPGLMITP